MIAIEPYEGSIQLSEDLSGTQKLWRAQQRCLRDALKVTCGEEGNVERLFAECGFRSISTYKHLISGGQDRGQLVEIASNWISIVSRVKDALISAKLLTESDFEHATQQIAMISERSSASMEIWKVEGVK